MITIVDFRLNKNSDGDEFVSLVLEGDPVLIQSKETGSFYATAKRASITSTFKEERAKKLIGRELPGSIIREESESYLLINIKTILSELDKSIVDSIDISVL